MFAGEVHKRIEILVRNEEDTAAFAAVSAIGTAFGDVFLPPEANTTVSSVARLGPDFRLIDKHLNLPQGYSRFIGGIERCIIAELILIDSSACSDCWQGEFICQIRSFIRRILSLICPG